jgi:predicted RecA/RadA family phage recombinase
MKNYVQDGDAIDILAPAALTAGQSLLVGDLFGVVLADAASGAPAVIQTSGVFTLPKATGSIAVGVRVFWDNTAKRVTTTATSNRCIGWHVGTAANAGAADTDILVKLGRPNAVAA